jgi:hypothetical protein
LTGLAICASTGLDRPWSRHRTRRAPDRGASNLSDPRSPFHFLYIRRRTGDPKLPAIRQQAELHILGTHGPAAEADCHHRRGRKAITFQYGSAGAAAASALTPQRRPEPLLGRHDCISRLHQPIRQSKSSLGTSNVAFGRPNLQAAGPHIGNEPQCSRQQITLPLHLRKGPLPVQAV